MTDQIWLDIIRDNPIGTGLDPFRSVFNSRCKAKGVVASSPNALDQLDQKDIKSLASNLLITLCIIPTTELLPSGSSRSTLQDNLLTLYSAVFSENFDYDRARPLLVAVITNKPDEEIWNRVYDAIAQSIHLKETPSYNTGSIVNSSESREDMDDILEESLGPMYVDLPRFNEAFFGSIPELEIASQTIFQKCSEGPDPFFRKGWTGWPTDPGEPAVLGWLQTIVEQLVRWARDYRPTPSRGLLAKPSTTLRYSTARRKPDVGIVRYPEALANWSHILIPGEVKSNPKEDRQNKAWFDIGKYVREVFAAQDTRRFVLAFTLCGPMMRLWEFDRLGGIASTQFDINENGLRFVSTILGFLWIEEKDLGFDPTFVAVNGQHCIEIIRDGTPERIVIDEVIRRVPCISSRATTCWKAHPEGDSSTTLVIKDSWQYPEQNMEGELLREITEKNVCNVARHYYHGTVQVDGCDDVQQGIRKGLDITEASNYQSDDSDVRNVSQNSRSSTTERKRSSSQIGAQLSPSKRPRSESPIKNRIHRRIIVRDYGQKIYEASSPVALLTALEGCIQGHESLYKAGILHRDISINNLMINENTNNPSWPSFLIDLDLAIKEQREGASRAKGRMGRAGTRAFMAIGVLLGEQHSFMHDIESFFLGAFLDMHP
ncbi:hypothetical protein O1611_g2895 [Lasiodiplodia mahajangana]|uniref:Uncharacterized protein n=1 Tax=Lasiodiplodia mahajangana TaxID=1108764 RepID=A0ACC2JU72_9PEZI|nr:hypothetical protein O1611_g2895 [Lasiodiplodia mahajangana]